MRVRTFTAVTMALVLAAACALADEGMWPLDELDQGMVETMQSMGLELSGTEIYDGEGGGVAYAVVSLGGGTGSFVSPKGLILTNNHVAFGALQRTSSVDQNYIADGFHAASLDGEIPAPGYHAYILLSVEDVTKKVKKALKKGMTPIERYEAIEKRIKEIIADAEKGRDVNCSVSEFYSGRQYKLFTNFDIKDVRIVYAPPASIGNYGGDIDNWMWPRHTGDFSFLRAYVAPDGSSAEYAEENVPYEPDVFLAVSTGQLREDDFTMVIGYPGSTQRYRSSYSIDHHQNWSLPSRIELFGDLLGIFTGAAEGDPAVAIKVARFDAMLNNSMKNNEGMLEGFLKVGLLQRKLDEEEEFNAWLDENPSMKNKYGDLFPGIGALYEEYATYREKNLLGRFMDFACQMLTAATTISRWCEEKEKPDMEREPGFQERDVPRLKQRLQMIDMGFDMPTDKKILRYFMMRSRGLPENQRVEAFDRMLAGVPEDRIEAAIDEAVEKLYAGTKLNIAEERMRMFDLSKKELMKQGDAFIDLYWELDPEVKALEKKDKEFNGAITELRPRLIEAYQEWQGGGLYPDANGTMRLTYGTVKGYSPREAIYYDYITSLDGVVEKHTGEDPFVCPDRLLDLYEKGDWGTYDDPDLGTVPVDFLSTCDITGGNSGSPILNGRGEVIGAAFDGNYESISADYLFDERLTRDINVDSRYILFILDKFSGARNLLDEMTIH